jgi:hypothetical protein
VTRALVLTAQAADSSFAKESRTTPVAAKVRARALRAFDRPYVLT